MTDQKTFIVGDIHGCLDPLKRLMDRLDWRPVKDRLIFLGDYIDRGPDPPGVVEYILELFKQSDMIECLIGNHEALFLDYLSGKDRRLFLLNGGTETPCSAITGGAGTLKRTWFPGITCFSTMGSSLMWNWMTFTLSMQGFGPAWISNGRPWRT